eukprot:m51a1_g354 putative pleckstrin domain-containing protein (617) ;mRNA; r:573558-577054
MAEAQSTPTMPRLDVATPHVFKKMAFKTHAPCDVCAEDLIATTGVQCLMCGFVCHMECQYEEKASACQSLTAEPDRASTPTMPRLDVATPHVFKKMAFKTHAPCDVCAEDLIATTGVQCLMCGFVCHMECQYEEKASACQSLTAEPDRAVLTRRATPLASRLAASLASPPAQEGAGSPGEQARHSPPAPGADQRSWETPVSPVGLCGAQRIAKMRKHKTRSQMTLVEFSKELESYLKTMEANLPRIVKCQAYVRRWMARVLFEKAKLRRRIMLELLETERSYVESLHAIVKVFYAPLAERVERKDLTVLCKEHLDAIFHNIRDIEAGNATLLQNLEHEFSSATSWVPGPAVGTVFQSSIVLLVAHVDFITNFDKSIATLLQTQQTPGFSAFLRSTRANPLLKKQDLNDLLIMPVQRIPRYVLLLQDLLSKTPRLHPGFRDLEEAVKMVRLLASFINDVQHKRESMDKLREELSGIEGLAPAKWRHYMRKGDWTWDSHSIKKSELCYLLNDSLVLAKRKKLKGAPDNHFAHVFRGFLPINASTTLTMKPDKSGVFSLEVKTDDNVRHLVCASQEMRDLWLRDITTIVKDRCFVDEPPNFLKLLARKFQSQQQSPVQR